MAKDNSWVLFEVFILQAVQIQFHEFDVEDGILCNYDHVALHDGESKESPNIGIFCGTAFPTQSIITDSPALTVHFKSDSSMEHQGFRAVISVANHEEGKWLHW